jgi:MarR family transcriptional regulator for hemolysin
MCPFELKACFHSRPDWITVSIALLSQRKQMWERPLSLQQEKKPKPRASRSAVSRKAKAPRWIAGVSADGELFLRRRDDGDAEADGHIKYSFSQGLTFVARRWRNVMNEELQAFGQSHVRWGTLYWISMFGDRVNQTQLAARMGIEQPTLGRVLRELEADGLIRRWAPSGDRRARVIGLTPASKPLMQQINRIQNAVRAGLLRDIDPAELASCLAVFAKILDNSDRLTAKWR